MERNRKLKLATTNHLLVFVRNRFEESENPVLSKSESLLCNMSEPFDKRTAIMAKMHILLVESKGSETANLQRSLDHLRYRLSVSAAK